MNDTVLSISLLNERCSATAVHRGGVAGTWERPAPIADVADLSSVLRDAVKQTAYAGTPATVVIAHQRLAQQLVETPPLKGQNLKSFLQRRGKQIKTIPPHARSGFSPPLSRTNR